LVIVALLRILIQKCDRPVFWYYINEKKKIKWVKNSPSYIIQQKGRLLHSAQPDDERRSSAHSTLKRFPLPFSLSSRRRGGREREKENGEVFLLLGIGRRKKGKFCQNGPPPHSQ
jgi:hypothetical protein